jgi:hypothetical protein
MKRTIPATSGRASTRRRVSVLTRWHQSQQQAAAGSSSQQQPLPRPAPVHHRSSGVSSSQQQPASQSAVASSSQPASAIVVLSRPASAIQRVSRLAETKSPLSSPTVMPDQTPPPSPTSPADSCTHLILIPKAPLFDEPQAERDLDLIPAGDVKVRSVKVRKLSGPLRPFGWKWLERSPEPYRGYTGEGPCRSVGVRVRAKPAPTE